ncbi:hypothetical protein TPY_1025 [Sulfobacillus acidophilus TPY]|uniref:Uncharacterized protein n=1 Tax=Sulfobacillus acidophilus (strain ATCC 700253 / DSM 10332 / NAL) TaxID=679936 RepID=G8TX83_SULAD|nr:hypothetical protein TPY_1025 [Sulfobacillus acidophilus TPY]AEW06085.1 hypothetical protein Sulac_2623 [Sulfobacillus acidophilus DSM 10332]
MIRLLEIRYERDGWSLVFDVTEGVYHNLRYPVRVVGIGWTEDPNQKARLGELLSALVRQHLRQGSLPPTGLLVPLEHLKDHCRKTPEKTFRRKCLDALNALPESIHPMTAT